MNRPHVIVSGPFDDIRSRDIRFLEEASRLGPVTVLVWPDSAVEEQSGGPPKFPLAERLYFLRAIRYVEGVIPLEGPVDPNRLPDTPGLQPVLWADVEGKENEARAEWCRSKGLRYHVFSPAALSGFPESPPAATAPGRKKVVVTGCFDWFHSGHVR
ncbi:MAG TPA: hypothetical protein PLH97_04705, partial [Verrucomicrobiota bacterium]|nr:hypothetical protein [Verrucomicrobiota bacterium]